MNFLTTRRNGAMRCLASGVILIGWALFGQTLFASEPSVRVRDLRCEYLKDPLGIDAAQPRLSWKLVATRETERGQRQSAYRILVAREEKSLARDDGDLWDSGWVGSDQSVHVVYQGAPLRSGTACYWKVRVKDENGNESAPSPVARWTMGLLDRSDWSAKWIGSDQVFERKKGWPAPDNDVPDPWLRKTFRLPNKPTRAVIYIASIGYHELYVNGQKVGDAVLSPAAVNHKKRARYVTYEITEHLTAGKNVIALWLGVSWSIFPQYERPDRPQTPIVIAQADVETAGGKTRRIATDASWKTHPSPNRLLGAWDFMHFGGESYNANKELPDWNQPQFDDSGWASANVYSPQVTLSAEVIEPNRRIREIQPIATAEVADGVYRIDMGVNLTGYLEMDVRGRPGDEIEFKFSERVLEPMTHRLHSRYIIGPSGNGTFCNRFNYFVGRWIQVEGLKYKPLLSDVRCFLIRTDYERSGRFESSNALLNDIYETTLWTFENLSLGGYVVDCAQRERMGYGGDAHATTECGLNSYSLGAFYTKWSQDWRDVQGAETAWGTADRATSDKQESGNLPYTAPTYWGGGGPAWSGYCVTLPWEIYRRYGDRRILEQNFETIRRWLGFLETKAQNNLLKRWGGQWDFLGDWLWPGAEGVNGDTPETLFFNNCYWIYNLDTAAAIAAVLGKSDAAKAWARRAEQVRLAVHENFFNATDNSYANGFQAYMAIALLTGVPPETVGPDVWKRLEHEIRVRRSGHIHAGITGGAFLFKTLLTFDRQDLIYPMVNTDLYPSWGDMLRRGATTIWESWDARNSLSHSSYLYVGTWFIEGLAGIRLDPQVPGFKRFIIKPPVLDDASLTWVKAGYNSIYGPIESNWKRSGSRMEIDVRVPPNTSALLHVPTVDRDNIQPASGGGFRVVGKEGDRMVLSVQPGRYQFLSRISR